MEEIMYTIKENICATTEIKKSKFICHLFRIHSEEEAKEYLLEVKKEHWKATHNCSAFILGNKQQQQRSSDDGEPSGTAGVPMLEVLKKQNMYDVLAVVTRYFGGIKLGAGGLIRAYGHAVSNALAQATIVTIKPQQEVMLTIPYPLYDPLLYMLSQHQYHIEHTDFQEHVTLTLYIDCDQLEAFQNHIQEFLYPNGTLTLGPIREHEVIVTSKHSE